MNQLKAGVILSYFSLIITIIVNVIYTPILLRMLGQTEFGLYSLINSFSGYLSILDMGLGTAIIRYISQNRVVGNEKSESELNGLFFILYSFIGIITAIIGIILYFNIDNLFSNSLTSTELQKSKVMMLILIFYYAVSFPLSIFSSIIQAYERFIFFKVTSILRTISIPCVSLPILLIYNGSVSVVAVNVIVNTLYLIVNVVYCIKKLKIKLELCQLQFGLLKQITGFSFFVFLNNVVDKVYWSTGQIILGIFSGTEEVALYAVAMQLIIIYMTFSTSISGVMMPKISIMVSQNASNYELTQLMTKIGRIQYLILAFILLNFILFGQSFIKIWAGESYINAYYIVIMIMVPLTFPLIQNIGISILQAKNIHGFRSVVYLCIAVLNVIVSVPLVKIWGWMGCAIATTTSILLGNIITMNVYYHRKVGLDMILFWKNISKLTFPVFLALLLGLGVHSIIGSDNLITLSICLILFFVVYALFILILGINSYEKHLVISLFKNTYKHLARIMTYKK